jgi:hypothetical protein
VPIRPPVPPDDDDPDDPRDRWSDAREAGPGAGDDLAGDGREGDGQEGDGLEDVDPAARPADLTADQLHAGLDGDGARTGPGGGVAGGPVGPVAEWRVDRRLTWIKLLLAVVFLAGPWVAGASAASKLVGIIAGGGLAVAGVRDLLAPVRLRVDAAGVRVVTGFANHRELGWKELERVRLDTRSRFGVRAELLEIDAGEELYFLSRYDLGVPPADALDRIRELRGVGGR